MKTKTPIENAKNFLVLVFNNLRKATNKKISHSNSNYQYIKEIKTEMNTDYSSQRIMGL